MRFYRYILILIILFTFSCKNESLILNAENIEYLNKLIKHDYRIKQYFERNNKKELSSIKYFYDNKLIEQVGDEYRKQYFYDTDGKLIKINNCRFNNCEVGFWEFKKYNKKGNLIGSFWNSDSNVNIDTVKIDKIKFYNSNNMLIKERIQKGKDINQNEFEFWKTYNYKDNKIENEIEFRNTDTIWKGKYLYDIKGRLIKIERKKESKFFNEYYEYDNSSNLIRKRLESNKYPIEENTSFMVNNYVRKYEYDKGNNLIKEIAFNHKGDNYQTIEYEIEKKY
jgi:hypothetical protein